MLAPYPVGKSDILASGQGGPSADHWLGTDSLGRDLLSRALSGARLSLTGPAIIVLGSAAASTALGILAAWRGGWIDRMLNRALNVMFAVPGGILVAVLASASFGAGFWAPVVALSIVYTPYAPGSYEVLPSRSGTCPTSKACVSGGVSSWRICTRHLLPNVAPIVLAQATVAFGTALADFAAVSFLGLGVQAPAAEWGLMVADGRSEILEGAIQQSLVAGLLIVVTVVAFNVLGERVAARLGGGPVNDGTLLDIQGLGIELTRTRPARPLVRDVSLAIRSGESVGLVGESGSGKSMTVKAAMRLLPADAKVDGDIMFEGRSVLRLDRSGLASYRRADVAMIHQDPPERTRTRSERSATSSPRPSSQPGVQPSARRPNAPVSCSNRWVCTTQTVVCSSILTSSRVGCSSGS